MLAVGTEDGRLRLLDADTGETRFNLVVHRKSVTCVAISADGTLVASGSEDKSWSLWDASTFTEKLRAPGHDLQGACKCTSPGWLVRSRRGDFSDVPRFNRACPVIGHLCGIKAIAFSRLDPRRTTRLRIATASSDGGVILWSAASGLPEQRLRSGPTPGPSSLRNAVLSVAFSPDSTKLACGEEAGSIRIWGLQAFRQSRIGPRAEEWRLLRTIKSAHTGDVFSLAYSPAGRRLASAGYDKAVSVWDPATGMQVRRMATGHTDWVAAVGYSPEGGKLASGSFDFSVNIWDAVTGGLLLHLRGHDRRPGCFCRVAGSWVPMCPINGHRGGVLALAFSHDGTSLFSGSMDRTVREWNATSGALLRVMEMGSMVESAAYGRDSLRDDKHTAFAMGLHARLGAESYLQPLEEGVVRMVLELV